MAVVLLYEEPNMPRAQQNGMVVEVHLAPEEYMLMYSHMLRMNNKVQKNQMMLIGILPLHVYHHHQQGTAAADDDDMREQIEMVAAVLLVFVWERLVEAAAAVDAGQ